MLCAAELSPRQPAYQAGNQPCPAGEPAAPDQVRAGGAEEPMNAKVESAPSEEETLGARAFEEQEGPARFCSPVSPTGTQHRRKSITSWRVQAAPAPFRCAGSRRAHRNGTERR